MCARRRSQCASVGVRDEGHGSRVCGRQEMCERRDAGDARGVGCASDAKDAGYARGMREVYMRSIHARGSRSVCSARRKMQEVERSDH